MASEVDICNLALAHLGDIANVSAITPPDASPQAAHCARFYPIARDTTLEDFNWRFAVRRSDLASVTNITVSWAYAYALPNLCVTPIKVLLPSSTDDTDTQDFDIETASDGTPVLYTDAQNAVLVYTVGVTDTSKFTPLFVSAVAWLLASHLAGPVLKGKTGIAVANACMTSYKAEIAKAKESSANASQASTVRDFKPDWIKNR